MAHNDVETLLAYRRMTAPLNPNPDDQLERIVNELPVKYRTYSVPFDHEKGIVMLPSLFGNDFGDQIDRYATLVDPNHNEFEILVQRNNYGIFFTKGRHALRGFYNIKLGSWVTLIFVGLGKFNIRIEDRWGTKVRCPSFCEVLTLTTNMRLLHGSSPHEICERKEFSEWVLGIGDGSIGEENDEYINMQIPHDLLIHSSADHIASIVDCIYPSLLDNMHEKEFFQDRAILTPKNVFVDEINDYTLDLIPGEEKIYLSCDSLLTKPSMMNRPDDIHTPEFLNTINASGLPRHKIRLKVGVHVMLMRNLDPTAGLCNGTRLIITKMGRYVLEEKVITGSNIREKVFIPRLSLEPSDTRIPFKFQRRQFPIFVCFAMTINKSQGQSLKQVGIYILQPIFSHGQLYVAISRVTSRKGLKILLLDEHGCCIDSTNNVVFKEIFRNV